MSESQVVNGGLLLNLWAPIRAWLAAQTTKNCSWFVENINNRYSWFAKTITRKHLDWIAAIGFQALIMPIIYFKPELFGAKRIKRELRRRSAIEPVIGHMKTDGHLGRCHLKGREGDADVILTAVGHNLRRILAWLRDLLRLILLALWRAFAPVPAVRWAS
jgi:IS5 family transposase